MRFTTFGINPCIIQKKLRSYFDRAAQCLRQKKVPTARHQANSAFYLGKRYQRTALAF